MHIRCCVANQLCHQHFCVCQGLNSYRLAWVNAHVFRFQSAGSILCMLTDRDLHAISRRQTAKQIFQPTCHSTTPRFCCCQYEQSECVTAKHLVCHQNQSIISLHTSAPHMEPQSSVKVKSHAYSRHHVSRNCTAVPQPHRHCLESCPRVTDCQPLFSVPPSELNSV